MTNNQYKPIIFLYVSDQDFSHQLLSPKLVAKHIKEESNYLPIGLIQVAIKRLVRLGLNASVLIRVRDVHLQTL